MYCAHLHQIYLATYTAKDKMLRSRSIYGRQRVQLDPAAKEDFSLSPDDYVAKCDEDALAHGWNLENHRVVATSFCSTAVCDHLWEKITSGLLGTTKWVVLFYLVVYYIINVTVIQNMCARRNFNDYRDNTAQRLLASAIGRSDNVTYFDAPQTLKAGVCIEYEATFAGIAAKEATFTRILTFLLGFYVSFTLTRWWKQVTSGNTIRKAKMFISIFELCDH